MSEFITELLGKELDEIPDEICCVCGHKLGNHVDEGSIWRCHSLGQDFYQCECALIKDKSKPLEGKSPHIRIGEPTISYYDLKRRLKKLISEYASPSRIKGGD